MPVRERIVVAPCEGHREARRKVRLERLLGDEVLSSDEQRQPRRRLPRAAEACDGRPTVGSRDAVAPGPAREGERRAQPLGANSELLKQLPEGARRHQAVRDRQHAGTDDSPAFAFVDRADAQRDSRASVRRRR